MPDVPTRSARKTPPRRPPSVIDGQARMQFQPRTTRERIVFTALDLIAEEGFRGFSVNEVIRKGGFSKGSFFFHFESLDALCLACYGIIRELMLPRLDADGCRSLRDYLEAFGKETLLATQSRHHFTLVYFFSELAMSNPAFREAQRELVEHYQSSLVREIRRFVGEGPREEVIRDLVAYMSIVLDGIASHRLMFEDPKRMARIWPMVIDTVVEALEGTPTRRGAGKFRKAA